MNLSAAACILASLLVTASSGALAAGVPNDVSSDPGVRAVLADPSVTCAQAANVEGGYYTCATHGAPHYKGSLSDMTSVKGTLGNGVLARAVPLGLPGHLGVAAWLVYPKGDAMHILVTGGDFMAKFEDGYFDTFAKVYDPADANCCPKNVMRRRYAYAAKALRIISTQKMPTPQ